MQRFINFRACHYNQFVPREAIYKLTSAMQCDTIKLCKIMRSDLRIIWRQAQIYLFWIDL